MAFAIRMRSLESGSPSGTKDVANKAGVYGCASSGSKLENDGIELSYKSG